MLGILILVFGLTRLINLMRPPLFIDEALYIGWSEAIRLNPQANWLISLKEAWAPLQSWLGALFTSIVGDPLLSLRLLSVFAGAISLFLIIKLGQVLFAQNKDKLAGWLLVLSPFALMYDRLGMRDSAVTMVSLIVLLGTSLRLLKKKPKAVYLIAIGIAMGLFLKNLTWFLPGLVLISYIWFRPKISRHDFGALILACLPIWFYLAIDTWHSLTEKNQLFLSFREISLSQIKANVVQVAHWWWEYLSLPVLILVAGGAWLTWKKHRQSFYLLIIFTTPVLLFEILVAKILFPRYFLFVAVISFLWAGRGLQWLLKKINKFS
jgi:4-amino-4-deoxy-L-arabinose transferase-like glycosyltransferase